jgi:hypothetical protein
MPGEGARRVEITDVYNAATAHEVIRAAQADYLAHYGAPEARFEELLRRREPR